MTQVTKYIVFAILVIAAALVALVAGIRPRAPQSEWTCINGQWESQGSPGKPMPDSACPIPSAEYDYQAGIMVKLYFANTVIDPGMSDCGKMHPVERTVKDADQPERKALELLLEGPTEQEKADGYLTTINTGVEINNLSLVDGVVRVDFDKSIEEAVGGSCRVTAIRAQITETLRQFESVKEVIISVEGRTEDILQP